MADGEAVAKAIDFELPVPAGYRDELMKPGDETKSGYVFLDLIQRTDMLADDLTNQGMADEANAMKNVARKLREGARKAPWQVETPSPVFSFGGVGFGR